MAYPKIIYGDVLLDEGFDNWLAGLPVGWTLTGGTVFEETVLVTKPSSSLKIATDGAVLRRDFSKLLTTFHIGCSLRVKLFRTAALSGGDFNIDLQSTTGSFDSTQYKVAASAISNLGFTEVEAVLVDPAVGPYIPYPTPSDLKLRIFLDNTPTPSQFVYVDELTVISGLWTTLNFTFPPVNKPGADDRVAVREDTVSYSGKRQSVYTRQDVFKTLEIPFVPQADLPSWQAFMQVALKGGRFRYYADSAVNSYEEFYLEDVRWEPRFNFRGYTKFTLKLRKAL